MLEANKRNCHKKLINALWEYHVRNKKSIGIFPFQVVYGVDTIFPSSLAVPVMKLLQEAGSEENDIHHRINQIIHLKETSEEVFHNTSKLHDKIKQIYDRKTKQDDFKIDYVVLRWDARNKDKGKHEKFDNLWKGPFEIAASRGQNAYLLEEMDGQSYLGGPVNGRLLKHYIFLSKIVKNLSSPLYISIWYSCKCKV